MKDIAVRLKEWINYFLYEPDKTSVIIHINILNPLYRIIETILDFVVKIVRKSLLLVISVFSKY